jgi:hypothetical protein
LFEVPEIYWNKDNPNNREARVLVYHNQWLYGAHFLEYADRLIKAIMHLAGAEMERDRGTSYPVRWDEVVQSAVDHANHADLNHMTETRLYYDDGTEDEEVNKSIMESKKALDFLEVWDNNNGYLFIKIKKDGTLSYDILNGTENANRIKSRTPMEFLELFYTEEEITNDFKETIKAIESLNSFERIDCFAEINSFIRRKKGLESSEGFNTRIEMLANDNKKRIKNDT